VKRRVAILFLAALALLVGASLLLLRSAWAGRHLCSEVAARARTVLGQPLSLGACRVDPFRLSVEVRDIRVGPAQAPLFEADRAWARLAAVQALGGRLELAEVRVERPRLSASLPPPDPKRPPARCPPEALAQVHVARLWVQDGAVDLRLADGRRVRVSRFQVRAAPPSVGRGLRAFAPARRTGLVVEAEGASVELGGRALLVDSARAEVDLALDLTSLEVSEARASGQGATLEVRGRVEKLCDPSLDLRVAAQAPLRMLLDLAGKPELPASGQASAEVRLTGRPVAPALEGSFELRRARLSSYEPGDVKGRLRWAGAEVQVTRLEVALAGGPLVARATVRLGREVALEGEARLEGSELGDVLARFGLPGAWVSMRVRGDVKASGTAWPLKLGGTAALELEDFRVRGHAWDRPRAGEEPILEFRKGRLDTRVSATPEAVRLEDARIRVGAEELVAQSMLYLTKEKGFSVDLAGGADLGELGHVASVPLGGRAALVGRVQAAPYGNPQVEVVARTRELRLLRLDLGDAAAEVAYGERGGLVLRTRRVDGRRGETRYSGDLAVDLGASQVTLDGAFEARGRLRDVFEAALEAVPASRVARDALDAPAQVEARLSGPAAALGVEFAARLGPGQLLGRPFDSGQASGRIEEGRRAVLDRVELRRGAGAARGAGWVELAHPFPWELEASAAGLPVEGLQLSGARWEGTVSGEARLAGSWAKPDLRFAGNGEGVQVGGVPVGSVQLGGTLRDGILSATGATEGVRFSGEARTAGDMPFEARAEIDVDDVTRFLPGGPPAGLRARARGEARAAGLLSDPGAARAEFRLADLQVGYADFRVQNKEPVVLATDRGRVEVRSLTLVGANTEFSLTGAREADGRLSLVADGSLDLRLLGGLLPGVTRPHGKLGVEAHVSGTAAEPLLVGSGRLRDAGFQLRDLPVAFSAMTGELAFSQNRVIFDRLPASVNGGRAVLDGELELARLTPARVRLAARLDEVPLRIPSWMPPWVSGQLTLAGTFESMLLSGKLDVVRALYSERVELEKNLIEVKRRVAAPRVFDKSGEWLRLDVAIALGGDIRVDNDLLRGGVRGELTLTGTLAGYGLVGSLAMTPGTRATFRGNEFILSHAVADFTERRRVRAHLDVHGEAQVRDYQVFMHLFGPFDDPQLQLTSLPALTQEDVVTLLSMGITSRDAAAAGGAGGVTGAATSAFAQALFSASGLDEQAKRFLAREGLFKDFTLRITSAYSESSGQVVPKAEVESKAALPWLGIRDLRLRYQAPIAGSNQGKGQRAQAEARFGEKLSGQVQVDNENPGVPLDLGVDLRFRWEWND